MKLEQFLKKLRTALWKASHGRNTTHVVQVLCARPDGSSQTLDVTGVEFARYTDSEGDSEVVLIHAVPQHTPTTGEG